MDGHAWAKDEQAFLPELEPYRSRASTVASHWPRCPNHYSLIIRTLQSPLDNQAPLQPHNLLQTQFHHRIHHNHSPPLHAPPFLPPRLLPPHPLRSTHTRLLLLSPHLRAAGRKPHVLPLDVHIRASPAPQASAVAAHLLVHSLEPGPRHRPRRTLPYLR